jgi:hypothetical protein
MQLVGIADVLPQLKLFWREIKVEMCGGNVNYTERQLNIFLKKI